MSGNDQHNFFYEDEPLESITGISWRFKTDGKGANVPMVINGVVYSGDDKGNFYALDCNSGQEIWHFIAGGKLHDGPSIKDQVAYIGTSSGIIYAIDITTGEEKWRIQTNGSVCNPPALADSLGFALSHDKKMYIFNLETGLIKDTITEKYILCGTPSIYKDNVYYPDWGGNFHCRDIKTGKTDLIFQTGLQSKWFTSPSISDSVAYFVNYDSNLYAVNLEYGGEIWRFKADGKICRAPSISDSMAIFTTTDSHLYSLSRKNGKLLWE
jgi:outer membrane protein assembly factor BamB